MAKYAANPGQLATSIDNVDLTAAFGAGDEFALYIPNQGTPSVTWQTLITGTITSITVLLEASLDGTNWFTIDTSSSITGEVRTVRGSFRFIRVNNSAVVGGAGDELTATFVYSNSLTDVETFGIQRLEVTREITSAELLTLFSTPVTLLPDEAGYFIIPKLWLFRRAAGNAYTLNGSTTINPVWNNSPTFTQIGNVAAAILSATAESRAIYNGLGSSSGLYSNVATALFEAIAGKGVLISNNTANFTVGTGSLFVTAIYDKVPLSLFI